MAGLDGAGRRAQVGAGAVLAVGVVCLLWLLWAGLETSVHAFDRQPGVQRDCEFLVVWAWFACAVSSRLARRPSRPSAPLFLPLAGLPN
eukprot:COSAG01_NODE_6981_length_3405_cov_8.399879_3_plen_89_part_00